MESVQYGVGRYLDEPYETALPRVVEALKAEGFGVISEIDVKKTMKEKLGVDVPQHVILGACNPKLAHAALKSSPTWACSSPATSSCTPRTAARASRRSTREPCSAWSATTTSRPIASTGAGEARPRHRRACETITTKRAGSPCRPKEDTSWLK